MLPSSSYTFIRQTYGTTSWLVHCITTAAGRSLIFNAFITDNVTCSDNFPLFTNIEFSIDLTYYDYNFKTLTQFALMKNYQTFIFQSMHCFVKSIIILFINNNPYSVNKNM